MNLKKFIVAPEPFEKFSKRISFNAQIAEFYMQLYNDTDDISYLKKSEKIKRCCTLWDLDYYQMNSVKEIVRVNLCNNKFCMNCQSGIALKRFKKFMPILEEEQKSYDLYHTVFTVPNPPGVLLHSTLNKMYKAYSYLNRYLSGKAKIKGYDFEEMLGYVGGIRTLEITFNDSKSTYHPHFHCCLIVKKNLSIKKTIENKFSMSYKSDKVTKFSDIEILLQKIWYLLMNDIRVNKINIDSLELGYSVIMNPFDNNNFDDGLADSNTLIETNSLNEIFKYTLKGSFKDGQFLTPGNLALFEKVLHRRRIIQGYGIMLNYDFESLDILSDEDLDVSYLEILAEMRQYEPDKKPLRIYENLNTILFNLKTKNKVFYISKNSIRNYLINQKTDNE